LTYTKYGKIGDDILKNIYLVKCNIVRLIDEDSTRVCTKAFFNDTLSNTNPRNIVHATENSFMYIPWPSISVATFIKL